MNWTEVSKPKEGVSHYDHVICETPLWLCLIEWKGWKKHDSYSITVGDVYVGEGYDLEEAKELVKVYLLAKRDALTRMLGF